MLKKILMFLMMFCVFYELSAQLSSDEAVQQAIIGALVQAKSTLENAPFQNKTVAILPIAGDDRAVITGHLKNILTSAKINCVEGKEDPMWDEIIKEIAWNQLKEDILDPETVAKFGKLKAAQVLLYGKIRTLDKNTERIYVEVELHATDVATKKHIWGGNFAYRFYFGKDMHGIITLDTDLRLLLKKNFRAAQTSLQEPTVAAKFDKNKKIVVIPLAGDIDSYMTGLAIEILTDTVLLPQNLQIPSLAQVKAMARDGQLDSDLVFYGAIRDLYRGKTSSKRLFDKNNVPFMKDRTEVYADIQLFVEDLKTGVVYWSKTITLHEDVVKDRDLTQEEMTLLNAEEKEKQAEIEKAKAAVEAKIAVAKKEAEKKAVAAKKEAEKKAATAKQEAKEQAALERADREKQAQQDMKKFYFILAASIIGGLILICFIVWGIKAWVSYHKVR